MKDLIVVGLDIQRNHRNYKNYHERNAQQQINYFCQRIIEICGELQTKHPDSTWLFTWRDSAILGGKNHLTKDEKQYLKESLQNITKQFPNSVIVSGPTPTIKKVEGVQPVKNKIKKAKAYFENNESILEQNPFQQFNEQLDELSDYNPREIYEARSTSFVVKNGQCVQRHDKMTPDQDDVNTGEKYQRRPTIFKPSNKKNNSSLIDIDGNTVSIEVCREHKFSVAKREALRTGKNPVLQLVLCAGSSLSQRSFCSKYVLHLDQSFEMQLIDTKPEMESPVNIHCYRENLLEAQSHLRDPLQPKTLDQASNIKPPLIEAIIMGDTGQLTEIIEKMKIENVNLVQEINQPWEGLAPLEISLVNSDKEVITILLENGADVNRKNASGATPLHIAIIRKDENMVQLLLDAGANPHEPFQGKAPMILASESKNQEILSLIISACASYKKSPVVTK